MHCLVNGGRLLDKVHNIPLHIGDTFYLKMENSEVKGLIQIGLYPF